MGNGKRGIKGKGNEEKGKGRRVNRERGKGFREKKKGGGKEEWRRRFVDKNKEIKKRKKVLGRTFI
jgi:hypothetical protein